MMKTSLGMDSVKGEVAISHPRIHSTRIIFVEKVYLRVFLKEILFSWASDMGYPFIIMKDKGKPPCL